MLQLFQLAREVTNSPGNDGYIFHQTKTKIIEIIFWHIRVFFEFELDPFNDFDPSECSLWTPYWELILEGEKSFTRREEENS